MANINWRKNVTVVGLREEKALKYGDLVQFDPIETVVQVVEANDYNEAQRLVKTFVISDRMADKLLDVVFPHLHLTSPRTIKPCLWWAIMEPVNHT